MKKIIVVSNNLHIGGVQKSLVNLLKEICTQYDVTLALFNPTGQLMSSVPLNVKVLPITSAYRFLGLSQSDVNDNFILKIKRNTYAAITRIFGRDIAISIMSLGQKKISGFDMAISFIHNGDDKAFYGGCNDFVLRHVEASKKIAFIHCDYGLSGANTLKNKSKYKMFDAIATCSQGCCSSFLKEIPELQSKTKVVYNCQDYISIREKSNIVEVELENEKLNLVTVARLGREKSVHRAVEAIAQCEGILDKIHYYIIGDGIERKLIEEKIKFYNLEKNITLLGELSNPYPYIKAADLLLIPSQSEAAPMVIGEAASLGTPVLSTETSSAVEMIIDTGVGWVCENSIEGIKHELSMLINKKQLITEKQKTIRAQSFNNEVSIRQFDELLQNVKIDKE